MIFVDCTDFVIFNDLEYSAIRKADWTARTTNHEDALISRPPSFHIFAALQPMFGSRYQNTSLRAVFDKLQSGSSSLIIRIVLYLPIYVQYFNSMCLYIFDICLRKDS